MNENYIVDIIEINYKVAKPMDTTLSLSEWIKIQVGIVLVGNFLVTQFLPPSVVL